MNTTTWNNLAVDLAFLAAKDTLEEELQEKNEWRNKQ